MEGKAGGDRDLLEHPCNVSAHARFPIYRGAPLAPSADSSDLPGVPMVLVWIVSLIVLCGVVRATVYVITGF